MTFVANTRDVLLLAYLYLPYFRYSIQGVRRQASGVRIQGRGVRREASFLHCCSIMNQETVFRGPSEVAMKALGQIKSQVSRFEKMQTIHEEEQENFKPKTETPSKHWSNRAKTKPLSKHHHNKIKKTTNRSIGNKTPSRKATQKTKIGLPNTKLYARTHLESRVREMGFQPF